MHSLSRFRMAESPNSCMAAEASCGSAMRRREISSVTLCTLAMIFSSLHGLSR